MIYYLYRVVGSCSALHQIERKKLCYLLNVNVALGHRGIWKGVLEGKKHLQRAHSKHIYTFLHV